MERKILRYIPKSKQAAIKDCWIDDDGMWIILNQGWNADSTDTDCRTIHEDNITDLRYQIAGIKHK